jgi:signal transduction histidine kinase
LKGEAPESIKVPPQIIEPPAFDWRELRRWNIDENRLPSGSIIRFRSPTAWEQYKWYLIVGGAFSLLEAILGVGLIINLLKRKRAERSLREAERQAQDRLAELERRTLQLSRLASQLTLAEQNARKHLASTLHDGLQQVLFSTAMTLDTVKPTSQGDQARLLQKARENVQEAMQAARTLSMDLFPPVLHLGGLPVALSWLAKRTQEQYGIVVNVTADEEANPEANDVRILLFEVIRELLFNAVKHARVDRVEVKLAVGPGDTIYIQVSDEGIGFDPTATLQNKDHDGLGLFSIRERLALLGGQMEVQSAPGKGARFILTIPRAAIPRLAPDGAAAGSHDTRWKEHIVYDSGNGDVEISKDSGCG